jgi:hypothetical protein
MRNSRTNREPLFSILALLQQAEPQSCGRARLRDFVGASLLAILHCDRADRRAQYREQARSYNSAIPGDEASRN